MFLVLLGMCCQAQVHIGSGIADKKHLPIEPNTDYSYSQSIYLASEINASGTINSLRWHYSGPETSGLVNSQDLTIYLGTTSKSSFTSETDWEPIGTMTEVYTGGITIDEDGFCTLQFQTSFPYNGLDNLVVAVRESSSGSDSDEDNFLAFETPFNRSLVFYSGWMAIDPVNPPFASLLIPFVPNVTFGGISQACPPPLKVEVTTIASTSVSFTWEGAGTNSTIDYYVSESGTAPSSTTTVSGTITGVNADVTTGLDPDTLYYIWVRNVCNGTAGGWSVAHSFRTDCVSVPGFIENFDAGVYYLPECWSGLLRGNVAESAMISVIDYESESGMNSVMLNNDTSATSADIILVSPNVSNLSAGTHRLKFSAMSNSGTSLQIGTIGSSPTAPFEVLQEVALAGGFSEYSVNFASYQGTNSHIAIRLNAAATYSSALLDDIRWETNPLCPDVTDIIVPVVGYDRVTVSWFEGGDETNWNVVYGTSSVTDPNVLENSIEVEGDATATLTELEANTFYKVWVRSVCGNNNGAWIGPTIFETGCMPTAVLNEHFDTTDLDALPECWSSILRGSSLSESAHVRVSASTVKSAPNAVVLYNSSSDTTGDNDVILVSPTLSNLSAGTHRLKFFAKGAGALEIGTLSSNNDEAVFTFYKDVVTTAALTEYTVDFTDNISSDLFIGIRHNTANEYANIAIDNLRWEVVPPCADVTSITVPTVTVDSATIAWTPASDEQEWDIVYATSEVSPEGLEPVSPSPTSPSFTLQDLDENTTYYAWVRSICLEGTGAWIGPVRFTTPCLAVDAINENFDGVTMPVMPSCWSAILRGATLDESAYIGTTENDIHSGPNALAMGNADSDTDGADDIIAVSPNLTNLGDATHRLRFYAKGDVSIQVGTLSSNTADAVFTSLHTVASTDTPTEFVLDFTGYSGPDTYIGIRHNGAYSYTSVFLDNIVWEESPACPDVTNIVLEDAALYSAIVSWSPNTQTAWEVVTGAATITDPNTIAEVISVSDSPELVIEELEPATSYKVWIRSVCGEDKGNWIGPLSFKTTCLPALLFSEGFESAAVPELPGCWTSILRGEQLSSESYIRTVDDIAASGTHSVSLYSYTYDEGNDIILVSPNLGNLSEGTHQLRFSVGGFGTSSLQIGTLNGNTNEAEFTLIDEIATTDTFTQHIIDFSDYEGTDTYIGFRHNGQQLFNTLLIDDVFWEDALSRSEVAFSGLHYYPNPVENVLNISNTQELSAIKVYNVLGQLVLDKRIGSTKAAIDVSNLSSGTYVVKVTTDKEMKTFKVVKQ